MLNKVRLRLLHSTAFNISRGFTLVETIVGIVVLSIAFTIFTSLIYPLANQSAEQVHQIRAAELGQSMLNEIFGRAFDENSDMSGGVYRCGEDQNNDGLVKPENGETCSTAIGPDSLTVSTKETRSSFDDVDDYDTQGNFIQAVNAIGERIDDTYINYEVMIEVIHDGNYDGNPDSDFSTAKLITVTIKTPLDIEYIFSVYKVNF